MEPTKLTPCPNLHTVQFSVNANDLVVVAIQLESEVTIYMYIQLCIIIILPPGKGLQDKI